jgi:hypothetical protein
MLVDQITPHLPKDNEEVNAHVKRLQAMLDVAIVADPVYDQEDRDRGHDDDHWESLHGDSASSITPPEERGWGCNRDNRDPCDVIRDRDARGRIESGRRNREREEQEQHVERDYDYCGPYYDQLHQEWSPEAGHIPGGIKAYSRDLKRVRFLVNFKPSEIEKYDGSTNLVEWLEVYQLAIEAIGGDSYVMANYLSVYLSSSAKTWLLELPAESVRSWNHLHRLFTSNFRATWARPGVDWDLASIVHKKGESLWEYIQHFCSKRNVILEVDDKSIVMLFKKGLRNSSLIQKLTMKNPRTLEQMFSIANRYALAEVATFDTREQKKESGTRISLPHPRATIRRENRTVLSMW